MGGSFSWVVPARHNTHHDDQVRVSAPDVLVPWSDRRQAMTTRQNHAARTAGLHGSPAYHRAVLRGLAAGRARRSWSDEAIIGAIQSFRSRTGRWPAQPDSTVALAEARAWWGHPPGRVSNREGQFGE